MKREAPKSAQSTHTGYTKGANTANQKKEGLTKNNAPQQAPNQSTKSTTEEPNAAHNLDHTQRLQSKTSLIPWSDSSLLSNTLLFLSFQTVQNKHKRAARETFFLFLPKKDPCQLESNSLTEEGSTRDTPNRANKRCQDTMVEHVINQFFLFMTKKTLSGHRPPFPH